MVSNVQLPKGRYVLGVSGGVDSVVLLDMLVRMPDIAIVVAHVDHGIRQESHEDAAFVEELAARHNLPFEKITLQLGKEASEERARKARYAFLQHIQQKYTADAIVTAHHQDDLLETAIINLTRGTGWRGIAALDDSESLRRPLLGYSKKEIIAYAKQHCLQWREDATNIDTKYLRNHIRHTIVGKMNSEQRQELLALIARQRELKNDIDVITSKVITNKDGAVRFSRYQLIMLPTSVLKEFLVAASYTVAARRVQRHMLNRAVWFVKTARLYKILQISATIEICIEPDTVVVRAR